MYKEYEEKIEKLISEMTLEEKIGQLTQEYTTNDRIDELEKLAQKGELGSCILAYSAMAGSDEQEALYLSGLNKIQKAAMEKSRMKIPVIYGRDIIHGSRTIFPIPLAQASTWDYNLIKESASIMCEEASYDGVHWTFAPMIDICNDPRWGRIIECPGEDVLLGKVFAKASVDGIQGDDMSKKGKLASCAKHYLGYGASQGGRDKDPTEWSDYSMRNRALPAFKDAIDSGIATVMSAFNEISGVPATASKYHLTDVLRGELGFEGFVVSDWAAVERLNCQGVSDNDFDSACLAINAGVDMDMVDLLYKNNLKTAVEKNIVSIETIDEAVRRILRVKFKLGLFENPYADESDQSANIMTKESLEKANEVSKHSMVLLKNEGILPLNIGEKITLKGPMANEKESLLGSWHAGGKEKDTVSLFDGLEMVNGSNNLVSDNESNICIVALGEHQDKTGEARTIADIELSDEQVNLIKESKLGGKKVIAVIFAGRPLAIREIVPYCDAILWAWHGGTMCGLAAAEIIFGKFNPCGKLPVTMPYSTGQIPIFYNHQRNERGLKWYYNQEEYVATDGRSTPLYVFGYGLSYTNFEYSNFEYSFDQSENIAKISFDISNTGDFDGFEIAQLYVSDVVASMARPIKELKAFEKVFIKKGEKKRICLSVNKDDLSFYDGRGNFVFEKGEFILEVAKNCNDICFKTKEYISFNE